MGKIKAACYFLGAFALGLALSNAVSEKDTGTSVAIAVGFILLAATWFIPEES